MGAYSDIGEAIKQGKGYLILPMVGSIRAKKHLNQKNVRQTIII
jgi:hypothetical protein